MPADLPLEVLISNPLNNASLGSDPTICERMRGITLEGRHHTTIYRSYAT
jgi:hypothetical protein